MTRDEVAKRVHWPKIIWTAGIVNVTAMLPQLYQLLKTKATEGLSLEMFCIYLGIQIAFCLEGYFKRNTMLFVCLGLSALVSTVIIALITYYRHFA